MTASSPMIILKVSIESGRSRQEVRDQAHLNAIPDERGDARITIVSINISESIEAMRMAARQRGNHTLPFEASSADIQLEDGTDAPNNLHCIVGR